MVSWGHDEFHVVVKEDVAHLVMKSVPHEIIIETVSLSGDEVTWAQYEVELSPDDIRHGGPDCG